VEDWAGGRDHRYKAGLDGCSVRTREKMQSLELSRRFGPVQSQASECRSEASGGSEWLTFRMLEAQVLEGTAVHTWEELRMATGTWLGSPSPCPS
jgi:hypothetical protein